jgi:HD-GYP domain-containing protein (c-di-GMP phosphodiesterase class II)
MTTVVVPASADVEELVEESRERIVRQLAGRDRLVTAALAVAFACVAFPLAISAGRVDVLLAVVLVAAYALACRVEFEIGIGAAVPTQLVFVPMLFVLPPGIVPLCVALGFVLPGLPDVWRGRVHAERLLVRAISAWYAVGPAVVLVAAGSPRPSWSHAAVFLAALAAQFVLDFLVNSVRGLLAFDIDMAETLRFMLWIWAVDCALTPVAFLVARETAATTFAVAVVLPLVGLLARLAQERQRRIDHALELSQAYRGTAFLLGDVVEADDAYTGSHSRDVVELTLAVADELGLSPRERRNAEFAALLHDIGKIRIPTEIINKPGPLTPEERELIETHTVEGERLLARVGGLLGDVGRIVRSCHERWDGGGYPDGLAGESIPRVARIVMCCDAFNAMTTDRSYRAALPVEEAIAELERNAGTQFDPTVVDALLRRFGSSAEAPLPMVAA